MKNFDQKTCTEETTWNT